jgi:uncharacterized protein
MKKSIALAGAALIVLAGIHAATAQIVGLGTNPPGNYTHSAGAAIAGVVSTKTGMQVRVQPYGGSSVYVPLIDNGELDLGFVNAVETTLAIEGSELFQNRKAQNLRAVSLVVPFVVMFYVKKDSPLRTMADLKGKTIPGGYASQQILTHMNRALFANGGYDIGDMKLLPVPNNGRGADEFAAGKTDAFYFSIGAGKVREIDAAVGGVRAIGIDESPEAVARMKKLLPLAYPMRVEPSPAYPGVLEPTTFMAFDYMIIAAAKTSDEAVYKFVKAMHGNREEMVAAFAPLRDFDPKKMANPLQGVTYHPGALKFYRDVGLAKAGD